MILHVGDKMDSTEIGVENKFSIHVATKYTGGKDFHMVKERVHYKDGLTKPRLRLIYDFKRPFYITKDIYRNHKQKKEYEKLDRVTLHRSTESNLAKSVGRALGKNQAYVKNLKSVMSSPYVYWLDITSTSLLKAIYDKKSKDLKPTVYTYAALDIETDIDTKDLTIITVGMGNKVHTVIWSGYFKNNKLIDKNLFSKLLTLFEKHTPGGTPDEFKNIDVNYEIKDNQIDMVKSAVGKLHEWKPDLCGIWNIDYDIPFILKVIKDYGMNPKEILSDPSIPDKYKYFRYVRGRTVKKTEKGDTVSLKPHERWNYCLSTSSFYLLDAMQVYNFVRTGQANVPGGYGLDNILKKETKITKLKFEDVESEPNSPDWHREVVEKFPLEYIVYNQWDVISMLILDHTTNDLKSSMPILSGITDFCNFNSSPRKVVDDLHIYYFKNKCVLGTSDPNINNNPLLGRGDWVVTLPASNLLENGLCVLKGLNKKVTSLRGFVYDLDAVSSYPNNILASNMSKQTTINELLEITDVPKSKFMYSNIDLIGGGDVNSVDYCNDMFGFPQIHEL